MGIKEDLSLTWKALTGKQDLPGWSRMNIASSGAIQLMAGLQHPGNLVALIIFFPTLEPVKHSLLPQSRGFTVSCENIDFIPGRWISVVKTQNGPLDLFTLMAADIAETLVSSNELNEAKQYAKMLTRIKAWQHFMKAGREVLSQEEELGLVGELVIVEQLINTGLPIDTILESWVGPNKADQDFNIGTGAIEVKSTLSGIGFPAKIQSLEQLDDSQRKPLFLAGCRFALQENGRSLPQFVDELSELIRGFYGPNHLFEVLLLRAGYHSSQAKHYSRCFNKPELSFWLVDNEFPRLVHNNVAPSVRSVKYVIELDHIKPITTSVSEVLLMLKGE